MESLSKDFGCDTKGFKVDLILNYKLNYTVLLSDIIWFSINIFTVFLNPIHARNFQESQGDIVSDF
jgi:hypothetical protein